MAILSFICALILSVLASALAEPKAIAKELDRSQQMMIAAKLLSHGGYFLIENAQGEYVPAKMETSGTLAIDPLQVYASSKDVMEVHNKRLVPFLVNDKGEIKTFEELKMNKDQYLADYRKTGYYKQPWKLIYEIRSNSADEKNPQGYVIPVNGYGLWDAIYGYIAIKPDGDTVIGISWYDQKETPGLGANIAEASWQDLFEGKKIFQASPGGTTDFKTAPIGITVVKGKVADVYGE